MEDQPANLGAVTTQPTKPEGLLYHYTDQKGLLGILESKSIWATHVRHLNDISEFTLGWNRSWEKLLCLVGESDYEYKDQLQRVYSRFRNVISNSPGHSAYYVWCLTDDKAADTEHRDFEGDRLSQWRGYSGAGNGFSLGFDASELETCFNATTKVVCRLGRCIYDEEKQNAHIEDLAAKHLKEFLDKWSVYFYERRDPTLSAFENLKNNLVYTIEPIMDMYADFIQFGTFMKHPGFLEEKEWRFAFIPENDGDCSFRESKFGLTPYLPIGLDPCKSPSALKRIVIGPGLHRDEWVETVKLLLTKSAISGVEVLPSQIPYRNW